jgi:hypothetical protein
MDTKKFWLKKKTKKTNWEPHGKGNGKPAALEGKRFGARLMRRSLQILIWQKFIIWMLYVAPLGHIILIPSQPVFALSP